MGFLSTCKGDLREPLALLQGIQATVQVARGTSGFHLSRCRGIGSHLKLRREIQASSPVVAGILGFLSSYIKRVRPHLVIRHGISLSSQVVKGMSGLLSNSGGELGLFLEV